MTWTYAQSTGHLFDPNGDIATTGYAGGNAGKNLEGRNNPDMQDRPFIGPLPVGQYTLGKPVLQSHLGPFAIPLTPDPKNEMWGRSAFYIHGDSIRKPGCASEGCIIVSRAVRERMWASSDHEIEVVRG